MDSGHTREERKDKEVMFVTHSHKVTTSLGVCMYDICLSATNFRM